MPFSEDETRRILDELRAGASVVVGGSRSHTEYVSRDGGFVVIDFDEGYSTEAPCTEDDLRRAIERSPAEFTTALRASYYREVGAAFARGDRDEARRALRRSAAHGDPYGDAVVFDAALAGPDEAPSESALAKVREKLGDFTAYHAFMTMTLWEKSPENARRGVAFVDALLAIAGPVPRGFQVRAAFHEDAGDLRAAAEDLERALATAPADAWFREDVEKRLAAVRAKI